LISRYGVRFEKPSSTRHAKGQCHKIVLLNFGGTLQSGKGLRRIIHCAQNITLLESHIGVVIGLVAELLQSREIVCE
jgi:hypothetical protein